MDTDIQCLFDHMTNYPKEEQFSAIIVYVNWETKIIQFTITPTLPRSNCEVCKFIFLLGLIHYMRIHLSIRTDQLPVGSSRN